MCKNCDDSRDSRKITREALATQALINRSAHRPMIGYVAHWPWLALMPYTTPSVSVTTQPPAKKNQIKGKKRKSTNGGALEPPEPRCMATVPAKSTIHTAKPAKLTTKYIACHSTA